MLQQYRLFSGDPSNIFSSCDSLGAQRRTLNALVMKQVISLNALVVKQVKLIAKGKLFESDLDRQPRCAPMGYEHSSSDNGQFSKAEAGLISGYAVEKLVARYIKDLWKLMLSLGEDGSMIFEAYTLALLANGEGALYEHRSKFGQKGPKAKKRMLLNIGQVLAKKGQRPRKPSC